MADPQSKARSLGRNKPPEGFASFSLPEAHRVRMRTTNGLERLNKEIKRRTRVARLFPNPESCLRLVSAPLCEQDEDWQSAKNLSVDERCFRNTKQPLKTTFTE